MLNDLLRQLRKFDMVNPGERVYCAVSGGADSMALLWGMYLLREKLGIALGAVHFNHQLRGEESQRDEAFVRDFCRQFDIPLEVGHGNVVPGKKGLEAAAREARYAFFETLPGKIATAHTADDNAETVLMHLVRGTGLKGLGGIAPVRGKLIRPMLTVTRQQVIAFLEEFRIVWVEDSSNAGDAFLRNRLRHHVMPLLKGENPCFAQNISHMAMGLREDEVRLAKMAEFEELPGIEEMRALPVSERSRILVRFLKAQGVPEPEKKHIMQAEGLIYSDKPSAWASFPGGVAIRRNYDRLEVDRKEISLPESPLPRKGEVVLEELGLRVVCGPARDILNTDKVFTVHCSGELKLRSRQAGDVIRLPGGSRTLKKLFIDRKIPAYRRSQIPVIADDDGVVGVYGVGANIRSRAMTLPALQIRFENF